MAIKKHTFILSFLGLSLLNLQFQCHKTIGCTETVYNFELGIQAYPDNDSINIGDTIWLEVNVPTTFTDIQTGRAIDYSNAANLGSAIGLIELLGNSNSRESANDFSYFLAKGRSINNPNQNLIREYSFEELNSKYIFKLGVIPAKTGVYRISVSDAANVYRQEDKCTEASFRINFKSTNQHLYYNEQNYGVVVPLPNNGYCFKVK